MNFGSISLKLKFFNLSLKSMPKVFICALWILIIVFVLKITKSGIIRAKVQGFCIGFLFFLSLNVDFINRDLLIFFYISRFKICSKIELKSGSIIFFLACAAFQLLFSIIQKKLYSENRL